ncbi:hypothetical protein ONZ51_g156 [Trametes cubensis]|uniref:Uncharacterized protein n=1 Tax=Trametes cubensis TaxID=1111947 RepID=A0AAD7U6D3_9APHY|nr:hypothetical protein ONZ51_g156 [Trametes cubensis]
MTAPDNALPIARAEIIALFMESTLFGIFTVLYAIAVWILLYREKTRGHSRLNMVLCLTSTMMWLLSIAHLTIDVVRAVRGFAIWGQDMTGGAAKFYSVISDPTQVAKNAVYIVTTLIADCFVTYRLWIVWDRVWWVLPPPVLLVCATAAVGVEVCIHIADTPVGQVIFSSKLQPWIRTFFSLSLTTNLLATLLIAARLLWANRRVSEHRAGGDTVSPYRKAIETVVQSAAIYSVALASLLGSYLAGSNAQYICLDTPTAQGITFTLITIRAGLPSTMNNAVCGGINLIPIRAGLGQLQTIGGHVYPAQSGVSNVNIRRIDDGASIEEFPRKQAME